MTQTTKHTPGPWHLAPSSNSENGTGWRDIVSTGGVFSPIYVGEALEADARLIAAAPDMLAALLWCEAVYGADWPAGASIRETIKHAKGL